MPRLDEDRLISAIVLIGSIVLGTLVVLINHILWGRL